ncbi:MAG: hypothetical protein JNJ56_12680 [Ignavibacteria bacterium]|nr:hypothetical protein [Ignavibacteria bacterium]
MNNKNLILLLAKLKTKVKESAGKIEEDELIRMINLIAKSELELRQNNGNYEEFEKEILKFIDENKQQNTKS